MTAQIALATFDAAKAGAFAGEIDLFKNKKIGRLLCCQALRTGL
ncbi:MAG: hypothetical protein ACFCVD_03300 [Nodosilinea sp.]